MFIGKLFGHGPSYPLLGILLFTQLAITSASWAIRNFMQSPLLSGNGIKDTAQLQASLASSMQREQKAAVLEASSCTVSVNCAWEFGLHVYDRYMPKDRMNEVRQKVTSICFMHCTLAPSWHYM